MPDSPLLSVIVPMYNEAANLETLFSRLKNVLSTLTEEWEIICVNDGSKDNTLLLLNDFHAQDGRIKAISFSRNFGKEAALTAGLDVCTGQAVIPIDADLQDPPELIPELYAKWQEGHKVVIATRNKRTGDSWMKRLTAKVFYKILGSMSTIRIPQNTGDFRLIDKEVVHAIRQLRERTRFMKGLFAWVGYPTAQVFYDRPARHASKTQWNYWRLWQFALDGIFSFSTLPLRVWIYLGVFISLFAFLYAVVIIIKTLVHGVDVPGYASLMCAVLFMGGIQLISLGVIGEYLGRIYRETKHRPVYLVEQRIGLDSTAL